MGVNPEPYCLFASRRAFLHFVLLPSLRYAPLPFQQSVLQERAAALLAIVNSTAGGAADRYAAEPCKYVCKGVCPIAKHACKGCMHSKACLYGVCPYHSTCSSRAPLAPHVCKG